MYLKGLVIKNFRKFGDKNNIIAFTEGCECINDKNTNDTAEVKVNIVPKTTLIFEKKCYMSFLGYFYFIINIW